MSPRVRLSLAAVAGLACIPPLAIAQAPRGQLRVMTYNIKHGQTNAPCTPAPRSPAQPPAPDCNLDLQASIAVMRAHKPDIVGVQEVERFWARSARQDEAAVLAAGLGMEHSCYAANLDHGADAHSNVPHQYGTVIVSRFPILDCSTRPLRRAVASNEQRGLTRALIDLRGVRLQFFNTHLHTTAADRLLQTSDIDAAIDAAGGPVVLVGDFNAQPGAAAMVPIYARFRDAWQKAGAPTTDNPNGHTSPARLSGDPARRIDYVFVSPQVTVAKAYVPIDAQTRLAADHYPVVADIALPRATTGTGRKLPEVR